jgi:hypothetical protein
MFACVHMNVKPFSFIKLRWFNPEYKILARLDLTNIDFSHSLSQLHQIIVHLITIFLRVSVGAGGIPWW